MQASQICQYSLTCTTSTSKYFLCVSKTAEDETIWSFTMPVQGFILVRGVFLSETGHKVLLLPSSPILQGINLR